ncbi:restriction endonuclease [Cytobacillus firmus]|uniref:restriction endonuclease n=1 Tax=Cytobacillus firmus TaxID=1399 RepID=UPI0021C65439|nr:restriction endonuclease [Cytobacillus firmus]MCU1808266.1 restriction endonuclease [Cytobacillus firmus]
MYQIEVRHEGLNKYKVIKGNNIYVVQQKAEMQKRTWNEMWKKKQLQLNQKKARELAAKEKQQKKELAAKLTTEATEQLNTIQNTLLFTLDHVDTINWEDLKDTSSFSEIEPVKKDVIEIPREPLPSDELYNPKFGIMDRLMSKKRQKKIDEINELYKLDHEKWEKQKERVLKVNQKNKVIYEREIANWIEKKELFLANQKENNEAVENLKESYIQGNPDAIVEYCDMVLSNSEYPNFFPQEFELEYNPSNKVLLVEYLLPSISDLPTLKSVKYIQSRNEFKEEHLSDAALNKIYDNLLYQITLRTIHELFEADSIDAVHSIVFNGLVKSIDKTNGNEVEACILSVQTQKKEFEEINLEQVDPKLCFKGLKGIGSIKLHSLTPIAPIIKIERQDSRFVSSYNIADSLDESDNLAAMDWEDFEHLIRELFEKEFNETGGEVRITRASRDGGVDAVAFDPDPIRGGKIIIQAKRYTNVVGVSSVRDLYGTVQHEGATKGILVSTADFGPDSFKFAKDKPITLINGSNLLSLLHKHGYKARIDIKQAKEILANNPLREL